MTKYMSVDPGVRNLGVAVIERIEGEKRTFELLYANVFDLTELRCTRESEKENVECRNESTPKHDSTSNVGIKNERGTKRKRGFAASTASTRRKTSSSSGSAVVTGKPSSKTTKNTKNAKKKKTALSMSKVETFALTRWAFRSLLMELVRVYGVSHICIESQPKRMGVSAGVVGDLENNLLVLFRDAMFDQAMAGMRPPLLSVNLISANAKYKVKGDGCYLMCTETLQDIARSQGKVTYKMRKNASIAMANELIDLGVMKTSHLNRTGSESYQAKVASRTTFQRELAQLTHRHVQNMQKDAIELAEIKSGARARRSIRKSSDAAMDVDHEFDHEFDHELGNTLDLRGEHSADRDTDMDDYSSAQLLAQVKPHNEMKYDDIADVILLAFMYASKVTERHLSIA